MILAVIRLFYLLASLVPQVANDSFRSPFFRAMAADNQKAIDAVKTLSCQFHTKNMLHENDKNVVADQLIEGLFLQKGSSFRSTYHFQLENSQILHCYVRDGFEFRRYERVVPPDRVTVQSLKTKVSYDVGNMMNRMLINHVLYNNSDLKLLSLSELRSFPHLVVKTENRNINGLETRYLQIATSYGTMEFWIDAESHGWIRRMTYVSNMDPTFKHDDEVLEFHQSEDGTVIPSMISRKTYQNDVFKSHYITTLTDIKLNEPLTDQDVVIPELAGKMCSNLDSQLRYIIDDMGRRNGPRITDNEQIWLSEPQPIYPEMNFRNNPLSKESLSVADVMAILLVSSLALAGLYWLIQSNRKARQPAAITAGSPTPESLPARNHPTYPPARRS